MRKVLLLTMAALALSACAPTYRVISGRCPTTTQVLGDFGLVAASIGTAALKWTAGKHRDSEIVAGVGVSLTLADNWAEVSCRK